jgi:prepilin peptidase CpaA
LFALFALAFHFGMMGGGDVKLIGALALWLPLGAVVKLLLVMSVAGGLLTLAMVARQRLGRKQEKPEVPYGVAIALGGFWVIGEPFLNRFG